MRRGLTRRTVVASALLGLLVGAAFAVLVRAIDEERDSADLAVDSLEVIVTAIALERLVADLETGQRGYLITGEERFLQPWLQARGLYRREAEDLIDATRRADGGTSEARRIVALIDAYVAEYSVPLVQAARRDAPATSGVAALDEGKRRMDVIRAELDAFVEAERRQYVARQDVATSDARRAVLLAAAGLAGSMLLILLFGAYLVRAVALPVRRAAMMAGRVAGGDLSTRLPETGTGEVGGLERAFNTMTGSLEKSRDELRRIADEQAALRRVATLVAHDVPPEQLFAAATAEVRSVFGAAVAELVRYEEDGSAVRVAGDAGPGQAVVEGERFSLEGRSVTSTVRRTAAPARTDYVTRTEGPIADAMRERGLGTAVGAPIVVGARLWGVMVAAWKREDPVSPEIEVNMVQFTELVGTAIANAQSRAELAASRSRVVATADETRRRIERDLHDGAQQSLVHAVIALKLARRALGRDGGPAADLVEDALGHAERANDELRELAHGILPATLSRGLDAAIETLVSRARLPVSVDVDVGRLAPDLEATAYFIVAEALTNTIKHARATRARVTATVRDGALYVEVSDDGVGGVPTNGRSGLLGLYDRVAAMNGELRVESPPGGGTTVAAAIPVGEG